MPAVRLPFDVIGVVSESAARATALEAGTPVVCGAADTIASLLGTGVTRQANAMVYYGATGTLDVCTVDLDEAFAIPERIGEDIPYTLGTYSLASGAALAWFRDQFCSEERELARNSGQDAYAVLDRQAGRLRPGAEGLVVVPSFLGQTWPEDDPHARAAIFGLTLSHTRAHVYRALLESFGYDLKRGLRYLERHGVPVRRLVAAGGGARSNVWRQIVSDITGLPQEHSKGGGAPLGDAFLAAIGLGISRDVTEIESWLPPRTLTEPRGEFSDSYAEPFELYLRLHECVGALRAG
jgi:xylulokinase